MAVRDIKIGVMIAEIFTNMEVKRETGEKQGRGTIGANAKHGETMLETHGKMGEAQGKSKEQEKMVKAKVKVKTSILNAIIVEEKDTSREIALVIVYMLCIGRWGNIRL